VALPVVPPVRFQADYNTGTLGSVL